MALELDHPVRWVEDRGEHLLTSAHTRDHHYRVTAYADRQGRILGDRRRDRRRCRRLWAVAAGAVPGGGDGGAQPARAVHDRELPGAGGYRRHQQDAARPLSRGRPAGGVLCHRAHDRRDRPRRRPRPHRGAGAQHGAAGPDAVYHGRRHALRQWRLSAERAAVRRAVGHAGGARAPAAGRARRQADRHRLCRLCRADRARCGRVRQPRRLDRAGVRELHRAHPRRRLGGADGRHPVARPGARNHAVADRRRGARHRPGAHLGAPRRHRDRPPSALAPSPRAAW